MIGILLLAGAISSSSAVSTLSLSKDSTKKCKYIKIPSEDGCNSCSSEVCTDGKTQWSTGMGMCTAVYCEKRLGEKPFDEKSWPADDKTL